jgi:iron(III) transport system substrate-binding protein
MPTAKLGKPACRLAIASLATATSLFAGACGVSTEDSGGGPEEPETEGITVYSGRIPAALGGAVDAYEAEADRDVQVRFADTAELASTLIEEGDNSPADVYFAQEPGAIGAVADEGLLAELPRDILNRVAPEYRDPEGRWVGVTGRARVLAYGEGVKRSELPDSPLELTDPKWEGRVGWGPVTSTLQQYVTALRLEQGEDVAREWLEGMVANGAVDYPNNVAIRDAIANGELDVGLLNHYYIAQAKASDPDYPVDVHFQPEDFGSLVLLTSVGVLESSDRKQEAFEFIRSLLSDSTQRFFTSSSKEYPLAKGVEADPALEVPLKDIPSPGGDPTDITEIQATVELMQETGAL